MNTIINIVAKTVFRIDCFLYRNFGYESNARKRAWQKHCQIMQNALDKEHNV